MSARFRLLAALCVTSVAVVLAFGATPALALQTAGTASDVVWGVVASVQPRVVPGTGVIVTDVRVIESQSGGGTSLTGFTMEGGAVGTIGMWSEQYTELRVGDSVIARVVEEDGSTTAVTAPIADRGLFGFSVTGLGSRVDLVAAGYVWDGLHWADSRLPLPYYVNASALPAGSAPAITAAAQTWENDSGSYMDYNYVGSTGASPSAHDGLNTIGSGTLASSTAIAQCNIWYELASQHIIEFDITYNTGRYSFATDGNRSAYDIQCIGTHELGHTLHLLDMYDAENSNQVMYGYGTLGGATQRTLAWGDIAGIRAIYPVAVHENTAPVALADVATVAEDAVLSVTAPGVLGNDTDADGDALTASAVTGPAHGILSLAANGSYTYTPAADFNGSDTFTYRAYDGTAYSAPVTVTITVTPVNDAPVAVADVGTVTENATLTVAAPGVLGNDTDADGDPLTAALVTGVAHGTLSLGADGSYTYSPTAGFHGADSFTYRAYDGAAYSAPVTVAIAVTRVNHAPVALADVATVAEDAVLSVTAPGVLGNDTDADGDALTANAVTGPAHGILSLAANGSYTYSPAADFTGSDAFTYRAYDGTAYSAPVTVTITVTPVNDAPVAVADVGTVTENATLTVAAPGVLGNDTDADGDPLTAALVTGVAHGTLSLGADGSYTYSPTAGFHGADSFTYRAYDGAAYSAPVTVAITVTRVNHAPVALADVATVAEDAVLSVTAPGVLGNDTDADGDALTANAVTGPAHGILSLAANGSYTYTPAADFNGSDTFTYRAYDGTAYSAPVTVTITVTAPAIEPTSITIRTAATTARIGQTVPLSGTVTPIGMIGHNIVVYVQKPGKSYWTYSSNRTVYDSSGSAAWLYKYYFRPGMVKGLYTYQAVVPAWPGFLTSTSPTTVGIRLR